MQRREFSKAAAASAVAVDGCSYAAGMARPAGQENGGADTHRAATSAWVFGMRPKLLASAGLIAALILGACGGGGDSPATVEDKPVLSLMGQLSLAEMDTKAKPLESNGGNGKGRKGTT